MDLSNVTVNRELFTFFSSSLRIINQLQLNKRRENDITTLCSHEHSFLIEETAFLGASLVLYSWTDISLYHGVDH